MLRDEHSFRTGRAEGEIFIFTVTADSHNSTAGTTVFTNTMDNIVDDAPDFHINIGDTQFAEFTRN